MSDSEGEACFYGTPLDPYDEDAFPKKRPIAIEEQVAKDAQGRRRFHGAFTGGFSAGFYNTVGSLEGWAPTEFKSSRSEKAQNKQQRPEDFMDDEDVGEFGIAPQTVRATADYATSKKRKKQVFSDGPIPGVPVLEMLLEAGNETVGYFLMKNMNRKQKAKENAEKNKTGPKVYGCAMPKLLAEDETFNPPEYNVHEIYKQHLSTPKTNTFGLGYVSLDKTHLNLFQPTKLTVHERNNKKLSISGQAFGVGAFEDDDEEIYVKDDMSRYDFELTGEVSSKEKKTSKRESLILDMFVPAKDKSVSQKVFPPPVIPSSFSGKHNIKKSRFEPLEEQNQVPDRKSINASIRGKYLGENQTEKSYTPSNQQHKQSSSSVEPKKTNVATKVPPDDNKSEKDQQSLLAKGLLFDRFVSATQEDDPTNILEVVKPTEITHGTKEMHDAVKLKMFGPLTRVTVSWQPNSLLCKRFNVPEPHSKELNAQKNKKRTKNLIFEYQKHSENDSLLNPGLSVQTTNSSTQEHVQSSKIDLNNPSIEKSEVEVSCDSVAIEKPKASTSQLQSNNVPEEKGHKMSNEKVLDITERVDVAKNTDLFKAVFLSSSESESEEEVTKQDEEKERQELLTANVVSESLVPKIKPTKEGILSNIDFTKFNSVKTARMDEQEKKCEVESGIVKLSVDDDTYGPKLPTAAPSGSSVLINETVVNTDEWVEKDFIEKHKKHKKKHKKEKDKDRHKKKHKHKSKR